MYENSTMDSIKGALKIKQKEKKKREMLIMHIIREIQIKTTLRYHLTSQ
jgi:hypothetical protein